MDATDPLIMILERAEDDDGQPAYILVQVSGELRVTLRRQPDARPVTVNRDAIGYTLAYGETNAGCATPEQAERFIRASLIPALVYG